MSQSLFPDNAIYRMLNRKIKCLMKLHYSILGKKCFYQAYERVICPRSVTL